MRVTALLVRNPTLRLHSHQQLPAVIRGPVAWFSKGTNNTTEPDDKEDDQPRPEFTEAVRKKLHDNIMSRLKGVVDDESVSATTSEDEHVHRAAGEARREELLNPKRRAMNVKYVVRK